MCPFGCQCKLKSILNGVSKTIRNGSEQLRRAVNVCLAVLLCLRMIIIIYCSESLSIHTPGFSRVWGKWHAQSSDKRGASKHVLLMRCKRPWDSEVTDRGSHSPAWAASFIHTCPAFINNCVTLGRSWPLCPLSFFMGSEISKILPSLMSCES